MTEIALAHDAASIPASGKARQILSAAKRVFMERGFGAASMDMIAREAGVSKATLYAHYVSKERLFALMVNETCLSHSSLLEPGALDVGDFRGALSQIGDRFIGLLLAPESLAIHRIVVAETRRFPELGRSFYDSGPLIMQARLASFLERGVEAGAITLADPPLAAQQFVAMLKTELHMKAVLGLQAEFSEPEKRRVVDAAVEVFMIAFASRRS
jgi:TetR/AcrR family transcriptional repressor of mexJK operon